MTLAQTYQSFLATPSATKLADNAAINYIPTLKTISGADEITKHFVREQKLYKRKREEILHSIESDNALCLEFDTTIEFTAGGGALLPGLDDNFLANHVVVIPMVHIVQFNSDLKIQQARIYWDQASLLKAVEVIGTRAKNWPVKDGADHVRVVKKSAMSAPISENTPVKEKITGRPKPVANAMRDPMATLELFAPRDVDQEEMLDRPPAPRGAARPPPREYDELFVAGQEESRDRSESPTKGRNRAKTGAGKNHQDSRLFSQIEETPQDQSPQKRVISTKYKHFEFSDGHDQPAVEPAKPRPRTKHQSQWAFEDFETPAKPRNKVRPQDQRTFTWSDDDTESPPPREKAVHHPRRDAETHFELKDDGTPVAEKGRGAPRGPGAMNKDSALYKNNIYNEEGIPGTPRAEGGIVNIQDRRKDFDPHWQMTEGTPKVVEGDRRAAMQRPISTVIDNTSRKKDFDSQFEIQDDSPQLTERTASDQNRTFGRSKGRTAGSSRRGAGEPSWSLTGEDEPQSAKKIYKTAGNGMGSRIGARGWTIGDVSGEE